jgi:outer membrane protein assembly factor BamB
MRGRRGDEGTVGRAGCPQPAAAATTLKKVWQCDFDPGAPKENIHDYLRNREESPSNFYSMPVFHNGRLYVTGGGDMYWGKRQAWLKCIDAANGTIRWSYALERHTISTPAITGSLVFVGDIGKHLHCVDAETGKPYWKRDLTGEVWASPLVADGKVYIANRKGDFFIFAASKEEKLLSTTKLDSQVAGTVTAANGTLFIATMKRLYAVGLPRAK